MSVQPGAHAVVGAAEFHPRDVPDANGRAVRLGPHDDVGEFLRRAEAPLHRDPVLELLGLGRRVLADRARGRLGVLLLDRGHDIGRGQAELGEPIGPQPDPHAEVGAEHGDGAHAFHPLQGIDHIEADVVVEERLVVAPLGRRKRQVHQVVGCAGLGGEAGLQRLGRQAGVGLRHPVLHLHRRGVGVLLEREGDVGGIAPRRGGTGFHVEYARRAVDCFLDRLGHGRFGGGGVGAGIDAGDMDGRQADPRILRDRQVESGDGAAQYDEQRHRDGDDGMADEEERHGSRSRGRRGGRQQCCRGDRLPRFG